MCFTSTFDLCMMRLYQKHCCYYLSFFICFSISLHYIACTRITHYSAAVLGVVQRMARVPESNVQIIHVWHGAKTELDYFLSHPLNCLR